MPLPSRPLFMPLLSCALLLLGAASGCAEEDHVAEVDAALRRWQASAPSDYVFVYQRSCFCPGAYLVPARVVVRNGKAVSASSGSGMEAPDRALTMDELFEEARDAAARNPDKFSLQTSDEWHSLETLYSEDTHVSDSGLGIRVTCFAPTEDDDACPLEAALD